MLTDAQHRHRFNADQQIQIETLRNQGIIDRALIETLHNQGIMDRAELGTLRAFKDSVLQSSISTHPPSDKKSFSIDGRRANEQFIEMMKAMGFKCQHRATKCAWAKFYLEKDTQKKSILILHECGSGKRGFGSISTPSVGELKDPNSVFDWTCCVAGNNGWEKLGRSQVRTYLDIKGKPIEEIKQCVTQVLSTYTGTSVL